MANILLSIPDDLLKEVDTLVAKRKSAASAPFKVSPKQRAEAQRLAETSVAAANEYLRSLRPPASRVTRVGVITEFIELGLCLGAADEGSRDAKRN